MQIPWAIDVLDADSQLEPAARIDLPEDLQLIMFEPGGVPVHAPLEAHCFRVYRGVHVAVAPARAVATVAELAPVTAAVALHPSFAATHTLVAALDRVAMLVAVNQLPGAPADTTIGGIGAEDTTGYPVLTGDGRLIDVDTDVHRPTPPVLLSVINMSLGPSTIRHPRDPGDAVQAATWHLARACVVVAAAGNNGRIPGVETLSAWAEPPWVLAVGATADEAGTELLARSSVGLPDDPSSGPDVIAYGVSALSSARRGTSFAAPRVSYAATLCSAALLQLRHAHQLARGSGVEGVRLVAPVIVDRFAGDMWLAGKDRIGTPALPVEGPSDAAHAVMSRLVAAGAHTDLRGSPDQVRALLLASARPLTGLGPHEQGAGFVSPEGIVDLLASMTARQWLALLGVGDASSSLSAPLLTEPLFDGTGLSRLETVVGATQPTVLCHHPTGELRVRPVRAD